MTEFVENLLQARIISATKLHLIVDAILVETVSTLPDKQLQMDPSGCVFTIPFDEENTAEIVLDLHAQTVSVMIEETAHNDRVKAAFTYAVSGSTTQKYEAGNRELYTKIDPYFARLKSVVDTALYQEELEKFSAQESKSEDVRPPETEEPAREVNQDPPKRARRVKKKTAEDTTIVVE